MKFTTLKCPECGESAVGSVETVPGIAMFADPEPDGSVDYAGDTEIQWNEQRMVRDPQGRVLLVCHNGHGWFSDRPNEVIDDERKKGEITR